MSTGVASGGGVGVAEGAGPEVVAVVEFVEGPSSLVLEPVVVTAEGSEVVDGGGPLVGVSDAVVDVAVDRRHAAAGEDADRVGGDDVAPLGRSGASSGDVGEDRVTKVGDGRGPCGVEVGVGHRAGEVGCDRTVSGEVAGMVVEFGEGGELDGQVDVDPGSGVGGVAAEQVDGDVGSELVDGSGLSGAAEAVGDSVDVSGGSDGAFWGEVSDREVSGAVDGRFGHHAPILDGVFVSLDGVFGIDLEAQSAEPFPELSGGQPPRLCDDCIGDRSGGVVGEVGERVDDDASSRLVDVTEPQRRQHPGESVAE